MRHVKLAATSGFAVSLFLLATPVMAQSTYGDQDSYPSNPLAQSGSGHVDANGMPTDHSTPAERAATAALNRQVSSANQAADARAAEQNAQYQEQRAHYEEQNARYHAAMQRHQLQQHDYDARDSAYQTQRQSYDAKYHHDSD